MDRIDGLVPRDVLPYNFGDNWLFDATPEEQRRLQDASVKVVADLHAIPDAERTFAFLDPKQPGETALARNLARTRAWYEFAVPDIGRSPIAERGLAWLAGNLPDDRRGGAVLGRRPDRQRALPRLRAGRGARLGDGRRSAPASWTCPGWCSPTRSSSRSPACWRCRGCRTCCARRTSGRRTSALSGVELGDLDWYHVYNAVQWCIVFMRTGARQIHFGEIERPDDIETLMHHKPLLEALLAKVGA